MKYNIYVFILIVVLPLMQLSGCLTFEQPSLYDSLNPYHAVQATRSDRLVLFGKHKNSISSWFSCVKDKPSVKKAEEDVSITINGGKGECFGIYFDPISIIDRPVIVVKAKLTSKADRPLDILAGFTDTNDGKTYSPEKAVVIKSGTDYTDYYFDYSVLINDKNQGIMPDKIKTVLIFSNILGHENLIGELLIKEISLCAKVKK